MDDVLCDYSGAHKAALKKQPEIAYPQSQYGFFRNLKPIETATAAFTILSNKFDVWILTAPSIQNPLCYTEKREWVETHLGYAAAEKLILSPHKGLLIGDYLIDDLEEGRARQNEFSGVQLVFGSKEYPDWYSILDYFKQYYTLK